ncbi:MAG TPA: class I SAM-dependent methyltransferase [Spirochaetota bacterium]|nr:class I SAM-dependent methyltransferase [Spirochaetota bacterium]
MKLAREMVKAGWCITKEKDGNFTVYAANSLKFSYNTAAGTWSVPGNEIRSLLQKELKLIARKKASPFISASRMTALNHSKNVSQPVKMICREKLLKDKDVLHLGTGLDRFANEKLLASGCAAISDYDPNFYPDKTVLKKQYDAVIANYVLNIVPPPDRKKIYQLIDRTLKPGGSAYLTVQGVWPVEHKYPVIRRYADGYLIKSGYNVTFRKGYTAAEFIKEIKSFLGGKPCLITKFYSNSFVRWDKA